MLKDGGRDVSYIAARGNNPRFNSRCRNDGGAGPARTAPCCLAISVLDVIKVSGREPATSHAAGVRRLWAANPLTISRRNRKQAVDYSSLRSSRGAEVLQKLLSSADVFITNQPSLVRFKSRGIDPDSLCAKYPRLVYCSITGYGFTGPKAGMPGYDILAQAEAGLMTLHG